MHLIYKIYEDKERKKKHYIDASSPAKSNWLRYVNCARNVREENVFSFGCDGLVFYMTTKDVEPNTELLTWYGENDGRFLGITRLHPGCYLIKKNQNETHIYMHKGNAFIYLIHFFYVSASELNLKSASHIRLSYMPKDSLNDYLKYHQNWFSNKYDKKSNKTYHGIIDTYEDGTWTMQREGNYTYYTGEQGLLVPFVCEHEPLEKE